MAKYRVKPGVRYGVGGQYGPGSIVMLPEEHAVPFLDKLELVEVMDEEPELTGEPELFDLIDAGLDESAVRILIANEYYRIASVQAASDDDLLRVRGIGKARLESIRAVVNKWPHEEGDDG